MHAGGKRSRGKSLRLAGWDYRQPGCYFVTICTRNKVPYFGKINNGEVVLTRAGQIVTEEWHNSAVIRHSVELDEWILMPNHLHALILLTSKPSVRKNVATPRRGVPTSPNWSPGSLGAIINQFKSKCTKRIRTMGLSDFAWQSRCFDHIVRNDRALNQIRTYIQYNPLKWELDRYYIRA